jgi:hypothetical protein
MAGLDLQGHLDLQGLLALKGFKDLLVKRVRPELLGLMGPLDRRDYKV